jgi:hypothetical protein
MKGRKSEKKRDDSKGIIITDEIELGVVDTEPFSTLVYHVYQLAKDFALDIPRS